MATAATLAARGATSNSGGGLGGGGRSYSSGGGDGGGSSVIDDVMISDNESGFTINYDAGPCPYDKGLAPLRARDILKVLAQLLLDAITLEKILIRCLELP